MAIRDGHLHAKLSVRFPRLGRARPKALPPALAALLPNAWLTTIDGREKFVFGLDGRHERDGLSAALERDFEAARNDAIAKQNP